MGATEELSLDPRCYGKPVKVFKQRIKQVLRGAVKGRAYLGRLRLEVSTEFRQRTVVAYTKAGASGQTQKILEAEFSGWVLDRMQRQMAGEVMEGWWDHSPNGDTFEGQVCGRVWR